MSRSRFACLTLMISVAVLGALPGMAAAQTSGGWNSMDQAIDAWRKKGVQQMKKKGISSARRGRIKSAIRRVTLRSKAYRRMLAEQTSARPLAYKADFLDDLEDLGKQALKVSKKVGGTALKVIPQTRVARCGLFGTVSFFKDKVQAKADWDVALTNAAWACVGVSLPPAKGKGPTPPQ